MVFTPPLHLLPEELRPGILQDLYHCPSSLTKGDLRGLTLLCSCLSVEDNKGPEFHREEGGEMQAVAADRSSWLAAFSSACSSL